MTASSFERHGIEHLSASSLNIWAAQPALWIMERLLGRRRLPAGIAAARGKAVEHGVDLVVSPTRDYRSTNALRPLSGNSFARRY